MFPLSVDSRTHLLFPVFSVLWSLWLALLAPTSLSYWNFLLWSSFRFLFNKVWSRSFSAIPANRFKLRFVACGAGFLERLDLELRVLILFFWFCVRDASIDYIINFYHLILLLVDNRVDFGWKSEIGFEVL